MIENRTISRNGLFECRNIVTFWKLSRSSWRTFPDNHWSAGTTGWETLRFRTTFYALLYSLQRGYTDSCAMNVTMMSNQMQRRVRPDNVDEQGVKTHRYLHHCWWFTLEAHPDCPFDKRVLFHCATQQAVERI